MKFIKTLVILLLSVTLVSCTSAKETSKNNDASADKSSEKIETTKRIDLSKFEPIYSSDSWPPVEVFTVFGDKVLLHNNNADTYKSYLLYDINSKQISEYNDDNRSIVGSGSRVIMNNSYYYSEVISDANGKEMLRVIELNSDGEINVIKQIEITEQVSSFMYFSKYDENNFLLIHRIGNETYIDKFNCETKSFTRFLTADSNDELKTRLEKVSVFDEQIYVLLSENGWNYLKVYNKNCELITSIELDFPLFKRGGISQFNVVNDYLILGIDNSYQAIYKIHKNELKEVEIDLEKMFMYVWDLPNIYSGNTEYFYLREKTENLPEGTLCNKLYAFELSTGELKCAELTNGEEQVNIRGVLLCENGDILLTDNKEPIGQISTTYIFDKDYLHNLYE